MSAPFQKLMMALFPGGSGAFGHFETTNDMSSICKAHFLRGSAIMGPPKVGETNMAMVAIHSSGWVNQEGEYVYVKYHFLADDGQRQFTRSEAVQMSGEDPDYSKRDLWSAIENGEKISWTAYVQVMKPEEADATKLKFDPFDVTKVWPRALFPMHELGKLILDKNPENFHGR
ncbi:uncharacterized protein GIQ15_01610 [Arthroderma uncinatum]|uniref:uncharacterized protein n=1 Tax=Arthroderma uncinatum TaxID=74035 RepID=UPI00144AC6C6|nr:uncharacterized protein GIQ15_01610 [Arthroderma uncinatum]KAF3492093.1 hypothetical protein GIQ15_01610 [Arthroderma uncinatum]